MTLVNICNLVTQAEIARKIGRTRQLVHQYITGQRGPGNFPSPVCHIADESPLWLWCEVAYWLCKNDMIKEDVRRDAESVNAINTTLEMQYYQQMAPELTEEIRRSLDPNSSK